MALPLSKDTLVASELIYNYSKDDMLALPEFTYRVTFDDTTIELTKFQLVISWFYWEYYRVVSGVPILAALSVTGRYTSSTHEDLGAKLFWHVEPFLQPNTVESFWELSRVYYIITNTIYNFTCTDLAPNVTTASLKDLLEIVNHPNVLAAKEQYKEIANKCNYDIDTTTKAISDVNDVVEELLYKNNTDLMQNGIKKMCTAGILSKGQALQLIGIRGYLADIDGAVFPYPIDVGYAEGFTTQYDMAIESRSASRALNANKSSIKESEYFNRKMQLNLLSILPCDGLGTPTGTLGNSCENWITVPWVVTEGDYNLLNGKNYMVGNETLPVKDNFDSLVDTTINLRSITGCGNRDSQRICEVCLGKAYKVIPPNTSIGYFLGTGLLGSITQKVLSTKHYEGSSVAKLLELCQVGGTYFKRARNNTRILQLVKEKVNKQPVIRIAASDVRNLNMIHIVDIDSINPVAITNFKSIYIGDCDKNGDPTGVFDPMNTSVNGEGSSLSTHVLHHLNKYGWTTGNGYIEFKLNDWNHNDPIILTPMVSDNVMLFLREVETFLAPAVKNKTTGITDFKTRGGALGALATIIRQRFDINIIQLEVFIRSCMCAGASSFDMPTTNESFRFESSYSCIRFRSLASQLAYQSQSDSILKPYWYIQRDKRNVHPLDNILLGQSNSL